MPSFGGIRESVANRKEESFHDIFGSNVNSLQDGQSDRKGGDSLDMDEYLLNDQENVPESIIKPS